MVYEDRNVIMEDIYILPGSWRHFGGKEALYNDEGQRNFAVSLEEKVARAMEEDGWTIGWPKDNPNIPPEDDTRLPFIKVKIKYGKGKPPKIVLITSRNRQNLGEGELEMLDYADIVHADMIIRPYNWGPIRGESGVSAYLQSLYVTIEEDYLEKKYAEDLERGVAE